MTKLDISLPDDVKALADQQVADGGYPSLSAIPGRPHSPRPATRGKR